MNIYHSSPIKNLKIIKPQYTLSHDKYIGNYVFGTKSKRLALMYMLQKGFPRLMKPELPGPYLVICAQKQEILNIDKGGSLYILPSKSFQETPQQGLSKYEMVSLKPVVPIKEIVYPSVISALVKAGINIYFTDESTFQTLINNKYQDEIVKTLPKYLA